jgi:hypothetical protein
MTSLIDGSYRANGNSGKSRAAERGILPGVTVPSENPSGELLLVAVVEMAPGNAAAGQRYEDAVLELLHRHGGSVVRRMRGTDSPTEVHLIRFRSRAGYESYMVDPDRLGHRERIGDAAPDTRVIEVRDVRAEESCGERGDGAALHRRGG